METEATLVNSYFWKNRILISRTILKVAFRWLNTVWIFSQTRRFSAADIGSDLDLVMMTFRLQLKRVQQQTFKRMKYNLEGLKNHNSQFPNIK